jgi:hypothetical protein
MQGLANHQITPVCYTHRTTHKQRRWLIIQDPFSDLGDAKEKIIQPSHATHVAVFCSRTRKPAHSIFFHRSLLYPRICEKISSRRARSHGVRRVPSVDANARPRISFDLVCRST